MNYYSNYYSYKDLEVVNLTEILNSKKFGKKSTRHFSTQTDCQKETVAAIQTDAQKKQAIPCLSNLIEENQVATKTSRIRRDTYRWLNKIFVVKNYNYFLNKPTEVSV